MTSMHFYSWRLGLKTGMYYLRSRPAADPIKFTLDVEKLLQDAGGIDTSATKGLHNVRHMSFDNKENQDLSGEKEKKMKIEEDGVIKEKKVKKSGFPKAKGLGDANNDTEKKTGPSLDEDGNEVCIGCGS